MLREKHRLKIGCLNRFRTVVAGPLVLQFDAIRHKLMEENDVEEKFGRKFITIPEQNVMYIYKSEGVGRV